jgi:ABC-type cobalamin/Fe3+-siderophores transport system ATPase subunit
MSFSGLEVIGGYFLNTQDIQLFKKHNQVASIVYGKNGSGKSSLSRAILEKSKLILGEIDTGDTEFSNIIFKELIPHPQQGTQQMQTSTINATNIYVYNEKFILDNIHFKEDGLDTIIMLGEIKKKYILKFLRSILQSIKNKRNLMIYQTNGLSFRINRT